MCERVFDENIELKDNAMLKHYPELWREWNFKKNDELGLDIYKVTKSSGKRAWWTCLKCNSDHDMIISNRTKGHTCGFCQGRKVNDTNSLASLNSLVALDWDYEMNKDLTPHTVTVSSGKKVWWLCKEGHSYKSSVCSKTKRHGCPYCSGRNANRDNNLAIINPEIARQWHPTKNGDVTPYNVKSRSGKKAWWICKKGHEWKAVIADRTNESGCPYCSNQRVCNENSLSTVNPDLASEWHLIKNGELTSNSVTSGSKKIVWWLGKCGHEWEASIINRSRGRRCPYCSNNKILVGFNDMWTTNPELASMLWSQEDGYRYTEGSNQRANWRCSDCGEIVKSKQICSISKQGLSCPKCSDGIKYPEKVMYHLFKKLRLEFDTQKTFEWLSNKRYDFYLSDNRMIVEVHGKQHYGIGFEGMGGRSLEEEIENDRIKYETALSNGIEKYIVIDASISDIEYIKKSIINSELNIIYNLSDIDWKEINKNSLKSLVIEACALWNDKVNIGEIAKQMKLSTTTISKYLKKGESVGLCDYKGIGSRKETMQLSLTGSLIAEHPSQTEASRKLDISKNEISECCLGKRESAGGFKWVYKENYEKLNINKLL